MVKSILICTLLFNELHYVILQYHLCSELVNIAEDNLLNCIFVNNNSAVRCDVAYRGDSAQSFDMKGNVYRNYEYELQKNYLHYKIMFKIIEPINTSVFCLGLESSIFEKVSDISSYNIEIRTTTLHYMKDIKSLSAKSKYNESIPAAAMELDTNCPPQSSTCNLILKVSVLHGYVTSPPSYSTYFPFFFWMVLQIPGLFGSYDVEFSLDFYDYESYRYNLTQFVPYLFNIRCLRLTGTNLGFINGSLLNYGGNHLVYLDLSNNKILGMQDVGMPFHTPILEALILADNLLVNVSTEITKFTMLKQLDISKNPINNFESLNIIKQLPNLKSLNIAFIRMGNVSILEGLLSKCKQEFQLEVLNMSYCDIRFLSEHDFNCQKNLKVIDLSHNNLKVIPSQILGVQRNLIALNVSNNMLDKDPHLILGSNASILDISKNRISYIKDIVSSGHVHYLDLSENHISAWSNGILFDKRVSNLNLSNNRIASVSKEMINSFTILNSIDLGGNLFDCSNCTLPEFQSWLKVYQKKVYNLGNINQLTCTLPSSEYGKYIADIKFDVSLCVTSYLMVIGVPVVVILVVIFVAMVLCYLYRFEITYMVHLIIIRTNKPSNVSPGKFGYDAFVCYSGHDRDWVLGELLPTMESEPDKYRLCLHDRDFPLGSYISDNVICSMETSRHTIVILTEKFIKSHWCQWELKMASHKLFEDGQEFLILIELERLDRGSLPRHLKYLLDTRTYLEWTEEHENTERAWRRLKVALGPSIHKRNSSNDIQEEIPLE